MEGQKERFGELDFVRFIAALSVVIYHYKTEYIESLTDCPELSHGIYAITKFGYRHCFQHHQSGKGTGRDEY